MSSELSGQPMPVSSQVAQSLIEQINRSDLRPGDPVPSEMQTARDMQVSRGSVREAYRTLAAMGVLEIGNGRSPRIKAMDSQVVARILGHALHTSQINMYQVQEARRGIEVQSAQLAAVNASPQHKSQLLEHIKEMRAATQDHERRIAADVALHTTLADASGNPLLLLLLQALNEPLIESLTRDLGDSRSMLELEKIVDIHNSIVTRVCAGDPVGAGVAMAYHFDASIAFKDLDASGAR